MSNEIDRSKKQQPTTGPAEFGSMGVNGMLFTVKPGIPIIQAAEQAFNRSDALTDNLMSYLHIHAEGMDAQQSIFALYCLSEEIKALLEAIFEGLTEAERNDEAESKRKAPPQQAAA